MAYKSGKIAPAIDSGWGLIYRLNDLWRKVESLAPRGKYDDWNFTMDRIFCNLLYREALKIEVKDGKIIELKLDEDAADVRAFLDAKIRAIRTELRIQEKKEEPDKVKIARARKAYYDILMLKDIWLRKHMHDLGLYLKEVEFDPGKAIYGGFKS